MKKIFIPTLLSLLMYTQTNAQIVVDVTEGVFNFNNVDLSDEFTEVIIENFLANESTETFQLRWIFNEGTCPEEWDFIKADNNLTYLPVVTSNVDPMIGINQPVPLEPGETESVMFLFLYPRQVTGCCQASFEFSDANDPDATPLATATYDIYVNSSNDCQIISNIFEVENNFIETFPNPTSGRLEVKSNFTAKNVSVFSFYGQALGKIIIPNNNELDLSHLPAGVYFLKLNMEDGKVGWTKVNKI